MNFSFKDIVIPNFTDPHSKMKTTIDLTYRKFTLKDAFRIQAIGSPLIHHYYLAHLCDEMSRKLAIIHNTRNILGWNDT